VRAGTGHVFFQAPGSTAEQILSDEQYTFVDSVRLLKAPILNGFVRTHINVNFDVVLSTKKFHTESKNRQMLNFLMPVVEAQGHVGLTSNERGKRDMTYAWS